MKGKNAAKLKELENIDLETLKKLLVFGSPIAKAVALSMLDCLTDGELLEELKKEFGS